MNTNWKTTSLCEISNINYGYTEKATIEKKGPKFLRITDIQNNNVHWDSVPYCKIVKSDLSKYQLFKDDIVFARTGATTGKSYLIKDVPEAVFASYLIRVQINDNSLLPSFLYKYFQTLKYWETISQGTSGSAQGGFNATKLGSLIIPHPPIPEQKRIVKILDKAFTALDKAKENAEKNLQNSKELFDSYLQSVFAEPGEDWEEKRLGEVCDIIGGGTPSKAIKSFYNGDIFWATVRDMNSDLITDTDCKITIEAVKNSSTNIIPKGNVVIATRVGLGKICLLENDTAINQDLKGIIPKSKSNILIRYLFRWLKSISFLIAKEGTGATVKGVRLPYIKSLVIPLPPLTEQKQIVDKLNTLTAETKRLESIYKKKVANLIELKKSLLKKAFEGKL